MYEIQRNNTTVIVRKGQNVKFNASKDSYLIYRDGDAQKVAKVGDLTDEQLLLALVNAVEIPQLVPAAH